ncbi:MAG: NYN domain-containing protein [Anaerolineales bacterium]|nr:NYN domain-containing protein [Anaerolineales bacterium]
MPYLIDGHNLIPKLGLSSIDDEMELVEILQENSRLSRKKMEVFFDGGQPGRSFKRKFGMLIAYFARTGSTADAAITNRLKQLGNAARNWFVVSSDQAVQQAVKSVRAGFLMRINSPGW